MSKNSVLIAVCGVAAMAVIDLSVVNVALPSIQTDLGADPADLQWVVVTYGVVMAGCMLLGGRLGDRVGHRRVLVAGILVLATASLVGGLSDGLGLLIAARAGQGLGAALAVPTALAVLSRTFAEGAERNRALGVFGAAGGTFAVVGSLAGGLLVEGPGWEWVFLVNVPAGAALAALVLARVPADASSRERTPPDVAGAVTLTAGLVAVALGVHGSAGSGWLSAATLVPLVGGLGLLGLFVAVEARVAAPLIPLSTLRTRSVIGADLSAGLMWATFLGLIYSATLFLQQVAGWSPLATGASTLPIAVLSLVVSAQVTPRVIARLGAAATLALGLAVIAGALLALTRVPTDADYVADLLLPYSVVGIGVGLAQVAVQVAAFAGVDGGDAGLAGGAVETSREMGGAIGLAVLVSVSAGVGDARDAFATSVAGAAVFAVAGALVALPVLRPTEKTAAPA